MVKAAQVGTRLFGCRMLLGSLVVLMLTFPVLAALARPILLTIAVSSVLLAGVVAVQPGRRRIRKAVFLTVLQIVLVALADRMSADTPLFSVLVNLALASMAALIIFGLYCVIRFVLAAKAITYDQILAGMSAYLLLGFAFGAIFFIINTRHPGSFAFNSQALSDAGPLDLMYFSFVTLATLGYGDITPVAPFARSCAQLEAVVGTLYIAVFMARLVSMRSPDPSQQAADQ